MEPLLIHLPADPAALSELRRSLRSWLEELGIVEADVGAIVAACSEVAANAIEHGDAAANGSIEIEAVLDGGDVVVRAMAAPTWPIDREASRYVAALLVDDVSVERSSGGTTVVLRKASSRGLR